MSKVGMHFRVDEQLRDRFAAKCQAEDIPVSVMLRELMKSYLGKTSQDNYATPISKNIPNAETLAAMQNVEAGRNLTKYNSASELFDDLGI